jgi:hypothetical protein
VEAKGIKKQFLILGIVVILVCVGLSGCDQINNALKSEMDRFIGTWVSSSWQPQQNNTFYAPQPHTYFSNGSCSVGNVSGTYETKDRKLVETLANGQITFTWDYSFSNNDTILTLTQVGTTFTLTLYKQ